MYLQEEFEGLLPGNLTWNMKMEVWKMIFLFSWVILRFHVKFQGCIFQVPEPGNWHIPPWSEKEIPLEKCQTVRDVLVFWRFMYQLICQACDFSGILSFETWTFNEFELKKNTTWFWIKKTPCQSSSPESCQVTMESVDELRMRFRRHPRHCYVAKMVWKAYYWLQTRWESTISLPWVAWVNL